MKKEQPTKEELIIMLQDIARELGHTPAKREVSDTMKGLCHSRFGKWCYALEAAGLKVPSERTLERRARKKDRWKKKHKEMSYRRSAAGRADRAADEQKDSDQQ